MPSIVIARFRTRGAIQIGPACADWHRALRRFDRFDNAAYRNARKFVIGGHEVSHFAVRDTEDPQWQGLPRVPVRSIRPVPDAPHTVVLNAVQWTNVCEAVLLVKGKAGHVCESGRDAMSAAAAVRTTARRMGLI